MGSTSAILYSANNKIGLGVFFLFKSVKHQTSTSLLRFVRKNWATPALPCSLLHFPTSTPKPRAVSSNLTAPAKKPAETLRFCRFSFSMCCMVVVLTLVQTVGFRIRLRLSATALIPSSTQNAPDFGCFRLKSGAFRYFFLFWPTKFLRWFLCILPHSGYRLKPSVIPCKREVSFLT